MLLVYVSVYIQRGWDGKHIKRKKKKKKGVTVNDVERVCISFLKKCTIQYQRGATISLVDKKNIVIFATVFSRVIPMIREDLDRRLRRQWT